MALIKCKECGNEVSKKAKTCPKCGAPVKQTSSLGSILFLGILIIIFVSVWEPDASNKRKSTYDHEATKQFIADAERFIEEANNPPLELISWRCESEHGYMYVRGQVKNITNKNLKNVMVVGTFKTSNGEFINSSDALIDYNPILPGQTSPFSTGASRNPKFRSCNIDFKELMGGTIYFTSAKQRIKEVQKLLKQHGYSVGSPDGIMGPNTRAAIKKFQGDSGMAVDGKASKEVLSRLKIK